MTDEIELIKFVVQNWNTIKQIPRDVWKKIRELYQSGDKALGFIRRKPVLRILYFSLRVLSYKNILNT